MFEKKSKCVGGGGKWFDEPLQMCLYGSKGKSEMEAGCDELLCVCEELGGLEENMRGDRCVCFIRDKLKKRGEILTGKLTMRPIWGG
ncbi:hypothetical protein DRQ25_00370 [Candidatus Fermentibacteria bacterium]|nr:MAG: hypothetical protein DRQ25_00370 [Candidatus Fermentibacteria bacterium]